MTAQSLPLFPLNTVLFPGGMLPLRIFETRYLDMVRDCTRNSTGFVVVALREGREVAPDVHFFRIGTLAQIIDWEQRPDGLLGILSRGEVRVRVTAVEQRADGLWVGEVVPLEEWPAVEVPVPYGSLVSLLERLLQQLGPPWTGLEPHFNDTAWVAARLTELLPLELTLKQQILVQDDPLERIRILHAGMLAAVNP